MRIPRWLLVLSAGAVAVALALLAASLVLVSTEDPVRPSATPTATPTPPKAGEPELAKVLDEDLGMDERLQALKDLSQRASSAAPLIRVVRETAPSSPELLQLRASAITALERFPQDGAAREFLVVHAFQRQGDRTERGLCLDVLAKRPDLEQCLKPLRALQQDPEPLVRERVQRILARYPAASPTPGK